MRGAEEADDLQETCLQVLRKPRFIRSGDDLAYLVGVLRNVYYTSRRQRARRPLLGVDEDVAASERATGPALDAAVEAHAGAGGGRRARGRVPGRGRRRRPRRARLPRGREGARDA